MSDVFSGAPENCDAAAAAEEENTKGREGDTMAVGSGTMLSLSVGFFPLPLLWKDGRGAAPPHRNRILLGGVGLTAAPK